MALGKQVRHYRDKRGLTLEELEALSGVAAGTIHALESRDSTRSKYAPALAKALGLTLDQLLDESRDIEAGGSSFADQLRSAEGQIAVWEKPDDLAPDENRVWVDRYDLICSAGHGAVQWEIRQKNALPFTLDFFRAIGSDPKDCRLAMARGDSMEHFLFDRDMIMIDVSKIKPRDGIVYAVCFEDEFLVKQLFRQAGGALTLHSFNDKYPDRLVQPGSGSHFEIVGEIVYRSGSGFAG
ncbi:S24 family peptidase [Pigmentiphaga sp. YJ18]|uniref:XRE family transcriptional regulator n=1 Tax=Pigmentiphaga sp. YJ18 TaxID=3134907 RepID=UPI003110C14E